MHSLRIQTVIKEMFHYFNYFTYDSISIFIPVPNTEPLQLFKTLRTYTTVKTAFDDFKTASCYQRGHELFSFTGSYLHAVLVVHQYRLIYLSKLVGQNTFSITSEITTYSQPNV